MWNLLLMTYWLHGDISFKEIHLCLCLHCFFASQNDNKNRAFLMTRGQRQKESESSGQKNMTRWRLPLEGNFKCSKCKSSVRRWAGCKSWWPNKKKWSSAPSKMTLRHARKRLSSFQTSSASDRLNSTSKCNALDRKFKKKLAEREERAGRGDKRRWRRCGEKKKRPW